jgi:hypothetical protein
VFFWVGPKGVIGRLIGSDPGWSTICGEEPARLIHCAYPVLEAGNDGSVVLLGTDVSGPHAGTIKVTVISAAGDTIADRRFPFERVEILKRVTDSIRTAALAGGTRSPSRAAYWRAAEFQPIYRPVDRVVVGRDGTIWICLRPTPAGNPWLIIARDGRIRGRLTVSENVRVMSTDRSTFWGVVQDQDGLESIVRYKILEVK